jgi:hypothetical protein
MQDVSASSPTAMPPQTFGHDLRRALGQHVQHRSRPRRQLHLAAVAPKLPGSGIKTK